MASFEIDGWEWYGRWRQTREGWFVCDPSLDLAVEALPFVVRMGIREGKNYSYAQAEALRPKPPEKPWDT